MANNVGRPGKYYRLINPDGKVVRGKGLKDFCKKYNFPYNSVVKLIQGKLLSYKGWHTFRADSFSKLKNKQRQLINLNTGERVSLSIPRKEIIARYKMTPSALTQLLTGKKIAYKGWVLDNTYELITGTD